MIWDRLERHLLVDGVFYKDKVAEPEKATIEAYTDAMREVRLGLEYENVTGDGGGSGALPDGASAMWEG